jgi:hypothetical protein
VRVALEHVFAAQKCRLGLVVRSVGLARATASRRAHNAASAVCCWEAMTAKGLSCRRNSANIRTTAIGRRSPEIDQLYLWREILEIRALASGSTETTRTPIRRGHSRE